MQFQTASASAAASVSLLYICSLLIITRFLEHYFRKNSKVYFFSPSLIVLCCFRLPSPVLCFQFCAGIKPAYLPIFPLIDSMWPPALATVSFTCNLLIFIQKKKRACKYRLSFFHCLVYQPTDLKFAFMLQN